MRVIALTILGFLVSCASPVPGRKIAAVETHTAEIDYKKSVVQIFPPMEINGTLKYVFYVQLKTAEGKFADASPLEITVKNKSGPIIDYSVERIFPGRFYVSLKKTPEISAAQLDFFVKGKALREQVKLAMTTPDRSNSWLKIIETGDHKITFELRLADKNNRLVELPDQPEIILDGSGSIEDITPVSEGVWKFSVVYPEENQIMYFSVRALGIRLQNLYRYQHVEK